MKLAQCHKTETKPETLLFPGFLNMLGTSGTAVLLTPRQESDLAPVPFPIEADTKYASRNGAARPKLGCPLPLGRARGRGEEPGRPRCHTQSCQTWAEEDRDEAKQWAPFLRKRLLLFFFKLLPY